MVALYRSSRQEEALAAFREARDRLLELGLEPSAMLRQTNERSSLTIRNSSIFTAKCRRRSSQSRAVHSSDERGTCSVSVSC